MGHVANLFCKNLCSSERRRRRRRRRARNNEFLSYFPQLDHL